MKDKNNEYELAGTGRRFMAYIIDNLLLVMVGFVVGFFAAILEAGGDVEDMGGTDGLLASLLLSLLYYWFFWTRGATLGQRMLGVRIIRMDGELMTGTDALVRYIVRLISWIPFLLGFIWAFFDRLNQTWHDKAAGTLVIRGETVVVLD